MLVAEFEGKNRDDAVKKALVELKLTIDQVKIEYIEEGKASFFGFRGGKPARIKVYYEERESDFAEKSKKFIEGIFERMTIPVNVAFEKEDNEKVVFKLMSEESGLIIGKRGKTLEAVQVLVNIAMNKEQGEWKKVILDIEGYRGRREEALKNLALKVADRVRKTGKAKILEAMNPFERRLIHITLQDFPDIETQSEGEGIFKRVKVFKKYRRNKPRRNAY
jgi:spoIIIJ-associated protein